MRRHTIETVRETIIALRDQETVYKTEVDDLKYAFNRAFEGDWQLVKNTKYLNTPHEERLEVDGDLYSAAPFEVRHWYGKKFSKFLEEMPTTEFKDSTVSRRNRWRPLFNALQDLIKRQVKGRKPAPKKEVVATRTQLRGICPGCFKQHALRNGEMVAHGYTLDYGFQNGSCHGTGAPHFGTEEGRDVAKTNAADAAHRAEQINARMDRFEAGEEHVTVRFLDYRNVWQTISNPTDSQKRRFIADQRRVAAGYARYAEGLDKMIATWEPAEPVEVEVEVTA